MTKKKNKNTISYRLKFIDSAIFMTNSLWHLVNNLPERFHKIKCKYGHDNEKCEAREIKHKDCECCLK